MADVSKIRSGNEDFNVKDTQARADIVPITDAEIDTIFDNELLDITGVEF